MTILPWPGRRAYPDHYSHLRAIVDALVREHGEGMAALYLKRELIRLQNATQITTPNVPAAPEEREKPSLICISDTFIGPGCGRVLTAEERLYYGSACEQCVRAGHERVEAWKRGGDDPDLDAAMPVPKPAVN